MNKIIPLFLFSLFLGLAVSAQSSKDKNNLVGQWKFEASNAREGFNSGLIEVTFAENKYSTQISFTGSDYKIPGEKVKVENDTVAFIVYIEGNDVTISLKMDGAAKMAGKATYSEGEIPLTLTRFIPEK